MKNNRVYILYILCFVIGFIVPIVISLLKSNDTIVLSLNPEKYEKEFLKTPSVALLDSINANTLSCFCRDLEYDNLIYYWVLKDSTFIRRDNNEPVSFRYTILSYLTDSTKFYSPNGEMIEFTKVVDKILQEQQ
jgi:hypothetical protein